MSFIGKAMQPVWLMLGLMILAACGQSGDAASTQTKTKKAAAKAEAFSATTYSLNYSHDYYLQYTVYDLTVAEKPAIGGANVFPLGGGDQGCCIALPKQWRPGMQVLVKWSYADRDKILGSLQKELEIPKYTEPGNLFVTFHDGVEVELVVSRYSPGQPQWPGRINQEPMEHCLATESKKKLCTQWSVENITNSPSQYVEGCKGKPNNADCKEMQQYCREYGGDEEDCSIE
ncbi:hypothetical protein CSQ89_08385 [Chitinimonas sp. BJB300]|nr:hypothetical protein CSQ89_08385 [Chitinimonas sp. BJB300]